MKISHTGIFALLITAMCLPSPSSAAPQSGPTVVGKMRACDVEALKTYPMREALKGRALPLGSPHIFFKAPDAKASWEEEDDKTVREALARGLATFSPEERPIVMLATIAGWTSVKDPMINYFVLNPGIHYDQTIKTLEEAGLDKHVAMLRLGHSLFGADFGTRKQRYDRWSDGYGTIRDVFLNGNLIGLSRRWAHLPDLLGVATARIEASPTLSAKFEKIRAETPDDVRLSYMGYALWDCVNHYGPPDEVSARLAELSPAHRNIVVTFIFQAEMLNGSVEQFFYNSSGTLAPDVVIALEAMGLPKHAAAIRKGMAMFPQPYARDLETRRMQMSLGGSTFSAELERLTGDVDDGAMEPAMIRTARDAGILPK